MNSLYKIIALIPLFFLLNSCLNSEKSSDSVYNTFTYLQNFSKHQERNIYKQTQRTECKIYQSRIGYSNEFHIVHSFDKNNHLSKTSFLEIRYLKNITLSNSEVIPLFFLLSIDRYNEKLINDNLETFSFFCCWINKSMVSKENKFSLEISEKIDNTTEQLYTTLTLEQVKNLFPDFNGNYNKIDVHQAVIDYNYFVSDLEFYNNIKIINFKKSFEQLINLEQLIKMNL